MASPAAIRLNVSASLYQTIIDPSGSRNQRDAPQQDPPHEVRFVFVFNQPEAPLATLLDRLTHRVEQEWGKPVTVHHLEKSGYLLPSDGAVGEVLRDGDAVHCVTEEEWVASQLPSLRHPWLFERHIHKGDDLAKWVKVGPHAANRIYIAFGVEEYIRSRLTTVVKKVMMFTLLDLQHIGSKRIGDIRGPDWQIVADWHIRNRVVHGVWTTTQVAGHRCAFQALVPLDVGPDGVTADTDHVEHKLQPVALVPPVARKVTVTGPARVGEVLLGTYTYYCGYGEAEGPSTFRWLASPNRDPAEFAPIAGATGKEYQVRPEDEGQLLRFEVVPVAADGVSGPPAGSEPTAKIEGPVPLRPLPARVSTGAAIAEPPVVEAPPPERSVGPLLEIEHAQPIAGRDIGMRDGGDGRVSNEFEIALKVSNTQTVEVSVAAIKAAVQQRDGSWLDAEVALDQGQYGQTDFVAPAERVLRFRVQVAAKFPGVAYQRYNDRRAHHSLPQPLPIRLTFEGFRGESASLVVYQANEPLDLPKPPTDRGELYHLTVADDAAIIARHFIAVLRKEPFSEKQLEIRLQTSGTRYWELGPDNVKKWITDAPLHPADADGLVANPFIDETDAKVWALVDVPNGVVCGLRLWVKCGEFETTDYCRLPFNV